MSRALPRHSARYYLDRQQTYEPNARTYLSQPEVQHV
jgi:hypothetical protein